jgi:tryptophan synthase alpha chain
MKEIQIMAHWVLGYPTLEESLEVLEQYAETGFEWLEIQIPFSHPTADGFTITDANRVAVPNIQGIEQVCKSIALLKQKFPTTKIAIMTYYNKFFGLGDKVEEQLKTAGVDALILPDLPFDSREFLQINKSIDVIPVIAPNISKKRLIQLLEVDFQYLYMMSNFNITGAEFKLHKEVKSQIELIRGKNNVKVGIGFGVTSVSHVKQVLALADFAIIGSAFFRAFEENELKEYLNQFKGLN